MTVGLSALLNRSADFTNKLFDRTLAKQQLTQPPITFPPLWLPRKVTTFALHVSSCNVVNVQCMAHGCL